MATTFSAEEADQRSIGALPPLRNVSANSANFSDSPASSFPERSASAINTMESAEINFDLAPGELQTPSHSHHDASRKKFATHDWGDTATRKGAAFGDTSGQTTPEETEADSRRHPSAADMEQQNS
jgi:hypothetical protein